MGLYRLIRGLSRFIKGLCRDMATRKENELEKNMELAMEYSAI